MRKAALVTCMLAACALSACTTTQAGHPVISGAPATSSVPPVFTDAGGLAVALKAQTSTMKSTHATFTLSTPQGNLTGEGDLRFGGGDIAMEMTMTVPGAGEITEIILPDSLYLKMPQGKQLAPGKPWIKISLDGTDQLSKTFGALMKSTQQNSDITKSLDQIKAAGAITKSATEKLDGTDSTHYWITVDLAKAAQAQTDPTLKDALQQSINRGVTTINEEMWISKDKVPAKIVVQIPAQAGAMQTITETFSDWGKPVNVTAPPADLIAPMPKLGA